MQYERASFEFTRAVQPKDYETSRATGQLSVVFEEGERPDVETVLQNLSEQCQSHVLAAVGKDPSSAKLAERTVNGGTSTAKIEGKGESSSGTAEAAAEEKAQDGGAASAPEPTHEETGSDPAAQISDEELKRVARDVGKHDKQLLVQLTQEFGLNRLTDAGSETRAKIYARLTGAE